MVCIDAIDNIDEHSEIAEIHQGVPMTKEALTRS